MKKSQKNTQRKSQQLLLFAVLAAAVAVVAIFLLTSQGEESADTSVADVNAALQPGVITAQDYQVQFIEKSLDHYLLDVRTPEEFESGHIANAANISVDVLASQLSAVPQDKPVVVYCRSGNRSAQAAEILRGAGYTDVYDLGGILAWQQAGYPVE